MLTEYFLSIGMVLYGGMAGAGSDRDRAVPCFERLRYLQHVRELVANEENT